LCSIGDTSTDSLRMVNHWDMGLYWFGIAPYSSVLLIVVLLGACYNKCACVSRKKVTLSFYSLRVGLVG
jgi:hypothetical protein